MMRLVFGMLSLTAMAACSSGTAPSTTTNSPVTSTSSSTPTSADNTTFGNLLNNVRAQNGAQNVTFDSRLAQAAQVHADDMNNNGFFSHTGSDGSTVGVRATRAGYNWRSIGENIARGQRSESEAMRDWTNSPGHHANNINPSFNDFALAKAGTGANTHWVLVLGSEQP